MATTALHVGHSATRPCKEAMDEPVPVLRAYSRFFPSIRIDRDGSELARLPGRGAVRPLRSAVRGTVSASRAKGRGSARRGPAIPRASGRPIRRGGTSLGLGPPYVTARNRDHEGVAHVRRGL